MTIQSTTSRGIIAFSLAAAMLGATPGASAQGIRGYYNPVSRTFTPLAPPVATRAAPALTTVTGTFKISVSVKIDPKIPTNVRLAAAVTITAQDPSTYNPSIGYVTNTGGTLARNGDAGTLSLTIPYIYKLADPTAPVTFTLSVYEPSGGTTFQPTSTRLTTIPLPKTGAVTTITLGETI